MTDLDTIAYQVLAQSGTALNTLIGARIYFAVAPSDFVNAQAALVYRPEGGEPRGFQVPVYDRSYLFECYGGDVADGDWSGAAAVYRALHDLWHDSGQVTVAGGVMGRGQEEQAGIPLVHPVTRFKFYQCRMTGQFKGA